MDLFLKWVKIQFDLMLLFSFQLSQLKTSEYSITAFMALVYRLLSVYYALVKDERETKLSGFFSNLFK